MTKAQFLRALARKLRPLPPKEREDALRYYREYLQEASVSPKEDVTPLVGTPQQAARGILSDSRVRQARMEADLERRSGVGYTLWRILAVPLGILLGIICFSTMISLAAAGAALVLGGAALPFLSLRSAGGLGQTLVVAGYGLLLIAVGILLAVGVIVLWRLTASAVAYLVRGKGEDDA